MFPPTATNGRIDYERAVWATLGQERYNRSDRFAAADPATYMGFREDEDGFAAFGKKSTWPRSTVPNSLVEDLYVRRNRPSHGRCTRRPV